MNNLSFFKNKKILITGASGIIGFNLSKELLKCNSSEIFINYRNKLDEIFLKELDFPNVNHLIGDVSDFNFLSSIPEFDIIFHLSGYGQPKKFLENPACTLSINSFSTDFLINKKLKKSGTFIFMSSSEVYSSCQSTLEDSKITIDLNNVRNPYIIGKIAGESVVNISRLNGVDSKSIRICLAYGPGFKSNDNRVINEFVINAYNESKIELMDDGYAIRKYIYIKDAIRMILKICETGKHPVYNVGGKDEISIAELAKEISSQTKSSLSFGKRKNSMLGSPNFAGVDISRYENEFGEQSFENIKDGVRATIEWYKKIKQ